MRMNFKREIYNPFRPDSPCSKGQVSHEVLGRVPLEEQLAANGPVLGNGTHSRQGATATLVTHIVQIGCPGVAGTCVLQGILRFDRHILREPLQRGLHAQRLEGVVDDVEIGCQGGRMYVPRNCRR